MPKAVKWFSNGRGFNFLPDFMERLPTGSRPLTNDPIDYNSTNNSVVFWRYYDPISIENQIKSLHNIGINNLRVWVNYYAWKYSADLGSSFFLDNLRHLNQTLDDHGMYCIWIMFDSLLLNSNPLADGNAPTEGAEYDDRGGWKYYPRRNLASSVTFFETSGRPYLSSVISVLSGYQNNVGYELSNELSFNHLPSSNVIKGLSSIREFDTRIGNGRHLSPGFVAYFPWHDVGNTSQTEIATQQWHCTTGYSTFITPHPYMPFPAIRRVFVDLYLSAGYDMNMPIYFTEGAFVTNHDTHIDFVNWCNTSGLGWNLYQGFSPNISGILYVGDVGLMHPDGEIRLENFYNTIKTQATGAGYKESWLSNLRVKSYYDNDGDNKSDVFIPPRGHPLFNFRVFDTQYSATQDYDRHFPNTDGEIPISFVLDYVVNYTTSATDLSAIRAEFPTENGASPKLLGEYYNQAHSLQEFQWLGPATPYAFGISALSFSSFIEDMYGYSMTYQEALDFGASATEWNSVALPRCVNTQNLPASTCLFGPGWTGAGCNSSLGDCFDWDAYTQWHKDIRNYFCGLFDNFELGSCTGIIG